MRKDGRRRSTREKRSQSRSASSPAPAAGFSAIRGSKSQPTSRIEWRAFSIAALMAGMYDSPSGNSANRSAWAFLQQVDPASRIG